MTRSVQVTYQAISGDRNYQCRSPLYGTHKAAEDWIANEAELNGEYRIEKRYELTGAKPFGQWIRGN